MAVADVFTAITEDRPYRKGMESKEAMRILRKMAHGGALNHDMVSLLNGNFDEVNTLRTVFQESSAEEYEEFINPQNPMRFDI